MRTIKGRENWLMCMILILMGLLFLALIWRCSLPLEVEEPVARTTTSYGALREEVVVVTATGTAGAATGSQDSDGAIRGHLYAMHLDYGASVTTTTDITISLSSPSLTVLTTTNSATDAWYYPAAAQTGAGGSGTGTYDRLPISGRLTAAVAQSTSGTPLTVTVWWGE